jgi:hypothetical protein
MLQTNDETVRDVSFFVVLQWKQWFEHDHLLCGCCPNKRNYMRDVWPAGQKAVAAMP